MFRGPDFATQSTGHLVAQEICHPAQDFGFLHATGDLLLPGTVHTVDYRQCDAQGLPWSTTPPGSTGTSTYAYPLWHMLSLERFGSPGMSPF